MKYILGFDLGTSSCKAVLYDENLTSVCAHSQEYPTFFPQQGWAEQPARQWWQAFCGSVRACLAGAGVAAEDVAAVGIDSMSSVVLPMSAGGEPLHPGLLWMDRRSVAQCNFVEARVGEKLFSITGNRNDPSNIAPKILWFKQTRPEIYEKTHKFLHANGYLVYQLTGVFSQDRTEGGLSLLYDIRKCDWSGELIGELGIDENKLPRLYNPDEVVGGVTEKAARECGLAAGTPVIAGAMDCIASALGTASLREGDVFIAGGTVTAVGIVLDRPVPHKSLHIHNHIIPGKYVWVSAVDFGGGGLRWFRDVMGETDYEEFDRIAQKAPAGNDGLLFLPYMVGQRSPLYNNNTSGVMFGLTPDHKKEHLVRMFMEGTSYAVRNILDYFRTAGIDPAYARLTGGVSNSETWTQILCDIINVDIGVPAAQDVAALGSAAAAAVGIGLYRDYDEALSRQSVKSRFSVNPDNVEIYRRMFSVFKNVFSNVLFSYEYARYVLGQDDLP